MSAPAATLRETPAAAARLARCIACAAPLRGGEECPHCGRPYPEEDGILHAIGPLRGTNRIAAAFYDGPTWDRFRLWERLFLWFQGPGQARARQQILRHLPMMTRARVLEVGIGDGDNLPLLPSGWEVYGVDIARSQLAACRGRFPELRDRLVWAEAEALPFEDGTFDAVYTVGGFNYFRDHEAALRELRRVARREAPVLVADEIPDLYRFAPGHALGFDSLDRRGLSALGLDHDFITMVFGYRIDIDALARSAWPAHRRFPIWNRLGYCLVDPDPRRRPPVSRGRY